MLSKLRAGVEDPLAICHVVVAVEAEELGAFRAPWPRFAYLVLPHSRRGISTRAS